MRAPMRKGKRQKNLEFVSYCEAAQVFPTYGFHGGDSFGQLLYLSFAADFPYENKARKRGVIPETKPWPQP